jgi:hypothetical protein
LNDPSWVNFDLPTIGQFRLPVTAVTSLRIAGRRMKALASDHPGRLLSQLIAVSA